MFLGEFKIPGNIGWGSYSERLLNRSFKVASLDQRLVFESFKIFSRAYLVPGILCSTSLCIVSAVVFFSFLEGSGNLLRGPMQRQDLSCVVNLLLRCKTACFDRVGYRCDSSEEWRGVFSLFLLFNFMQL